MTSLSLARCVCVCMCACLCLYVCVFVCIIMMKPFAGALTHAHTPSLAHAHTPSSRTRTYAFSRTRIPSLPPRPPTLSHTNTRTRTHTHTHTHTYAYTYTMSNHGLQMNLSHHYLYASNTFVTSSLICLHTHNRTPRRHELRTLSSARRPWASSCSTLRRCCMAKEERQKAWQKKRDRKRERERMSERARAREREKRERLY